MFIFTLGVTVLLVKIIPVGHLVYYYLIQNSAMLYIPKHQAFTFITLTNYIAALIIAVIFVNAARLRTRLPSVTSGTQMIVIGLVFLIVSLLPQFYLLGHFAPAISLMFSGSMSFLFLLSFIAHLLIMIGVVQTLLQIEPHHAHIGRRLVQENSPEGIQELDPEWLEKTFGNK